MNIPQKKIAILSRRQFVLQGSAAAALVAGLLHTVRPAFAETAPTPPPAPAEAAPPVDPATSAYSAQFDEALKAILKSAQATEGTLSVELPELAENGNVVPYTIKAESPMTDTDYVRTLHLLSTANPQALVASFHLVPASGKAEVSGRMRLAKTQDVVALAELSNDTFQIATAKVEVTIGGCGNE